MKTIIVTAATDNIGREVVAALAGHDGAEVLLGTRHVDASAKQLAGQRGVRAVELNMDRVDTLEKALEGVDAVCQVSPLLSPSLRSRLGRVCSTLVYLP